MKLEDVKKAQELKKEINDLDAFMLSARMVWSGKLIIEKRRYIFKSAAYGRIGSKEIELNTEVKNKVLDFLEKYRQGLIKEIEEL